MAVRTIACLPALIGAWRHHGGGALLTTSGTYDFDMDRLDPARPVPARHAHDQHDSAGRGPRRRAPRPAGPGPLRLQLPTRPPSPRTRRACSQGLRREDLFTVVHEQFPTDTVDYADIVLPATTQLEHFDVHGSYGHLFVHAQPARDRPAGRGRSNNDVFRALAARLGFEPELFPDDETLIREALGDGPTMRGITLDRLRAEGLGPPEPARAATPPSPRAASRPPRASASSTPSG